MMLDRAPMELLPLSKTKLQGTEVVEVQSTFPNWNRRWTDSYKLLYVGERRAALERRKSELVQKEKSVLGLPVTATPAHLCISLKRRNAIQLGCCRATMTA